MNASRSALSVVLMAALEGVTASASAGIAFTSMDVLQGYVQSGPNTVTISPDSAGMYLQLAEASSGDFDGVTVSYPGPASPATLTYLSPPILLGSGQYRTAYLYQQFPSIADLNSAFPFGTYTFTATNSTSSASQSASLIYDQNHWPSAVPALTAASFANIQGMNPGAATMFSFGGFTGDGFNPFGNGQIDPNAQLYIYDDATGNQVYVSPELADPNGVDYLLPADSLLPNKTYDYLVDFSNVLHCGSGLSCGQTQPIGYALGSDYETFGQFSTAAVAVPPQKLVNFEGGTPQRPVPLRVVGQIGEVNGTIGSLGSTDFYQFYWSGGAFQASVSITGANPNASYDFELLDPFGNRLDDILLDLADNFTATMNDTLPIGLFEVGLDATSPLDPSFAMTFDTPVQGVAEPATLGLAGLGVACIALARRRLRRWA